MSTRVRSWFAAVQRLRRTGTGVAATVTAIIAANGLLGIFSSGLLAHYYGAGAAVDAYVMAQGIGAMVIRVLLLDRVPVVYLPQLVERFNRDERQAWGFAAASSVVFVVLCVLIGGLGWLMAAPLVGIVASGFSADGQAATVNLLHYTLPTALLSVLSVLFATILQSRRQFLWPYLLEMVFRVVTIVVLLLLASRMGIELLAGINLVCQVGICVVQWGLVARLSRGEALRPVASAADAREMAHTWWPYAGSTWSSALASISNRNAASRLALGSVAALGYAEKLFVMYTLLSAEGVAAIANQELAQHSADQDHAAFARRLRRFLETLLLITLPIVALTLLLAERIIRILFGRGQFLNQEGAAGETALLLMGYAVLLAPEQFSRACASALQQLKLTLPAVRVEVAYALAQAALFPVCAWLFGPIGILAAMILGRVLSGVLYVFALRYLGLSFADLGFTRASGLMVASALVASGVCAAVIAPIAGSQSTETTLVQIFWTALTSLVWIGIYGGLLAGQGLVPLPAGMVHQWRRRLRLLPARAG